MTESQPDSAADETALERGQFRRDWVGRVSYVIFNRRRLLLIVFVLVTIALAAMASQLRVQAGFTKMIPLHHPYMSTFLRYAQDFGGANKVLVAVRNTNTRGSVFEKDFMETLRDVTDEVFFIKGVERSSVTSLFTSNVRYNEVVEDGFRGGNIVAADFAGKPEQLRQVRENVLKSDWVGRIVSNDQSAAMVVATLQENDPDTGERLDLQGVARQLEAIRDKYEKNGVSVHIIGFAKAMGDIASGAAGVLVFFGLAFVITAVLLYWYSGSLVITTLALICAIVPVIWLLGLLPLFGLGLDPMSILVPFLIFSIAVSHAVQMTNAWKLETLHGADGVTASTHSFQKLFIPGAMALLANALGFMVIAFVDIEIVRELAYTATIGVTVMILTNKILLPILLSYYRFTPEQASKLAGKETAGDWLWERIGGLATKKVAWAPLLAGVALLAFGISQARHLHIGDLGQGVPELRASSRYNQDVGMITSHFAIGVDLLQVIAEAKAQSEDDSPCVDRAVMDRIEDFEFQMRQVDGVATVRGLAGFVKSITQSFAETFAKWRMLPEERADCTGHRLRHADGQRVHELTLHRDAREHLHDRSPGDDDRTHRRAHQGIQGGRRRHRQGDLPARERQRRRHGRDQRGRRGGRQVGQPGAVHVGHGAVPARLPLAADHALRGAAARARHGALQRTDGDARHWGQGQYAAGRRARRRRRRRLRYLSVRAHEARNGR
jgi:predicted RND superfamily exporter protein